MQEQTALNIYSLSVLLLEQLDNCEGSSLFKNKFKFHAKGLIKEIENFDKSVSLLAEVDQMNEFINRKREKLL